VQQQQEFLQALKSLTNGANEMNPAYMPSSNLSLSQSVPNPLRQQAISRPAPFGIVSRPPYYHSSSSGSLSSAAGGNSSSQSFASVDHDHENDLAEDGHQIEPPLGLSGPADLMFARAGVDSDMGVYSAFDMPRGGKTSSPSLLSKLAWDSESFTPSEHEKYRIGDPIAMVGGGGSQLNSNKQQSSHGSGTSERAQATSFRQKSTSS